MLEEKVASQVIDHAVSLGAYFVDLFVERNQVGAVSTLSAKVQSVESGIDFGVGVRLAFGTKVLYGYTNKTEPKELMRIASELAAKDLRDPAISIKPFDFIEVNDAAALTNSICIKQYVSQLTNISRPGVTVNKLCDFVT